MKKSLLLLTILSAVLVGCSRDTIKDSLKEYVVNRSEGIDVKYKFDSYKMLDTITVGNMIDSLSLALSLTKDEPDLAKFKELRDQEFSTFRRYDKNYEEKVMRGELKDASQWCTEIRVVTEKADSLIGNWDNVKWSSYDYNYLYWWYLNRQADFYSSFPYELKAEIKRTLAKIEASKDDFEKLNDLLGREKNEVYQYVILHKYSIYNPLFGSRISLTDKVYFNDKMEYSRYE